MKMKTYRPSPYRIPELNGLRVLLVFIVSWYHIWQQSWWTPHIGSYSLDFLVRAGYVPVDGTILLSGFLLFLPHARSMLLGERVPDTRSFYERRVMRIVPSYYFVTLVMLGFALYFGDYWGNTARMMKDVLMHFTFTQTFNYQTYIATPIGVASWTIAIEMQAYLLFPLVARWARKNPLGTLMTMGMMALVFRAWCIENVTDHNMYVNQLVNFLDVYAIGMVASMLYVKLTTLYPQGKRHFIWQSIATAGVALSLWGLKVLLQQQAFASGQQMIQAGQMMRRPLFASLLTILTLCLPFAVRPLRFLMGNRVMGWLAAISMNYYLMHQNIAVILKKLHFPPSLQGLEYPNMATGGPERPWVYQYTALAFGISLLTAILITVLVEKPCAKLLGRAFKRLNASQDAWTAGHAAQKVQATMPGASAMQAEPANPPEPAAETGPESP